MKKALTAALLAALWLIAGTAAAEPLTDIKVNGSDGPITVNTGEAVTVTISLDPQESAGLSGDWFVYATTPDGLFSYWPFGGRAGWLEDTYAVVASPLFTLDSYEVEPFVITDPGEYHFFFGVDLQPNFYADAPTSPAEAVVIAETGGADSALTGLWGGAWANDDGTLGGDLDMYFFQSGNQIRGNGDLDGSPCFGKGSASGTISGTQVIFAFLFEGDQFAVYRGNLNPAGTNLNGTYEVANGACAGETGVWSMDLVQR